MEKQSQTVNLKIKSATSSISDLEITCSSLETVGQVKTRVSQLLPSKPSPQAQKLVYSGRILGDMEKLQELLRWEDDCEVFTFHLVCKVPAKHQPSTAPQSSSAPRNPIPTPTPTPSAQASQGSNMEQMMADFSEQYSAAMASMAGQPSEQEVAALQGLYNQYLSIYMQFLASQGTPIPHPGPPLQAPALDPQDPPAEADPNPHHAQAAPNAALVMNAGGAAGAAVGQEEVGDRERNRDVLDWVYVMTRVLLLVSIIYFHSSFFRLAFVTGLGFLVYVFQNRRLAMIRRQEMEEAAEAARAAQAEVNRERERAENEEEEIETGGEEMEQEPEPEPAPSKFAVALTFVTSLVTSIVPDQNQVV